MSEQRPPLHYLITERLTQPQFLLAVLSGVFLWWLTSQLLIEAKLPDGARELVSALVGFISGQMVGPGWQFYFGNTKSSDDKTKALSDNAAVLRRSGIPLKQEETQPVPVVAVNAAYANLSDDELRAELMNRLEDAAVVNQMDRPALLTRLTELDAEPKEIMP